MNIRTRKALAKISCFQLIVHQRFKEQPGLKSPTWQTACLNQIDLHFRINQARHWRLEFENDKAPPVKYEQPWARLSGETIRLPVYGIEGVLLRRSQTREWRVGGRYNQMNTHWIYTLPGSLIIAALLAWPMSRQDSQTLYERIRFCFLTMLGFALAVWGSRQQPTGFHGSMGYLMVDGSTIAMMAAAFLILLWFDKAIGMMADLLLGCMDFPDNSVIDPKYEAKQMDQAVQLFRSGKSRRALRLCHRIIESNSQYMSTATTLAYWIENPGTLRFNKPPRTTLIFKGKFSSLNHLWIF